MTSPTQADWPYFLERLIHDLREPLRSVHSYAELLGDVAPDAPEEERRYLRSEIVSGAQRMRTLLDALSSYAVALRPEEGTASLPLAFNMALMTLDRQIAEVGAAIPAPETAQGSTPRVAVSLERTVKLFENVIGNALKFHGEKPVTVTTKVREVSEAGYWLVEMKDNCIGMDPRDCESAFRPILRIHGRKYPGVGLGLTICQEIVSSHGGKIWLESTPGEGTICSFTLPRAD